MYVLPVIVAPVASLFLARGRSPRVPADARSRRSSTGHASHSPTRSTRRADGHAGAVAATGPRASRAKGRCRLPEAWGKLRIVAAPYANGAVGVLIDEARQTASATMVVRTESFALLADADQERRVAAWGGVLSRARA